MELDDASRPCALSLSGPPPPMNSSGCNADGAREGKCTTENTKLPECRKTTWRDLQLPADCSGGEPSTSQPEKGENNSCPSGLWRRGGSVRSERRLAHAARAFEFATNARPPLAGRAHRRCSGAAVCATAWIESKWKFADTAMLGRRALIKLRSEQLSTALRHRLAEFDRLRATLVKCDPHPARLGETRPISAPVVAKKWPDPAETGRGQAWSNSVEA